MPDVGPGEEPGAQSPYEGWIVAADGGHKTEGETTVPLTQSEDKQVCLRGK